MKKQIPGKDDVSRAQKKHLLDLAPAIKAHAKRSLFWCGGNPENVVASWLAYFKHKCEGDHRWCTGVGGEEPPCKAAGWNEENLFTSAEVSIFEFVTLTILASKGFEIIP